MNLQEYYDLLVKSAFDGTFPSIDKETGKCKYRGPNNTKCAIGLLIPDECYTTDMENKSAYSIVNESDCNIKKYMPRELITFSCLRYVRIWADEIQIVHDTEARQKDEFNPNKFICELNKLTVFNGVNKYDPTNC